MGSPERQGFVESVAEYLLDSRSKDNLKLLLTEEEAWKQFVEGAGLSREEAASLYEALSEIFADADTEDEDKPQNGLQDKTGRKEEGACCGALEENIVESDADSEDEFQRDMQDKKRLLDVYPQVKLELEQHILKLRALADKIDKVHRDCTITQVVAGSTNVVSGVLTILGLALAPVTVGISLGLTATGLGLGAAASVTSVSTSIVEKVSTGSAEAEARQLVPTSKDTMMLIKEVLEKSNFSFASVSKNLGTIKNNIDAIRLTNANPHLANNAKRLMTTGRVSAQNTKKVQKAFGGTPLAMTKGVRITGAVTTGLFLLMDVVSLVEDSKHLHEGAKAESAAELRRQAQDLEQKLQELIQVHDCLTQ